jgi:uncharacterized protein
MKIYDVIDQFYEKGSVAYDLLIRHGRAVAKKALFITERVAHLQPDSAFIEEAALLHDIGMIRTNAPQLGCFGNLPYIAHGYAGREMLEQIGLPLHALVCERHVGTGLTIADIVKNRLPLPLRDMTPQSLEEQIICFADKFFSKDCPDQEKDFMIVRQQIAQYGEENLHRFDQWVTMFLGV